MKSCEQAWRMHVKETHPSLQILLWLLCLWYSDGSCRLCDPLRRQSTLLCCLPIDRGNDVKTTSKSGLALNGIYYYGKPRIAKSGESWF